MPETDGGIWYPGEGWSEQAPLPIFDHQLPLFDHLSLTETSDEDKLVDKFRRQLDEFGTN